MPASLTSLPVHTDPPMADMGPYGQGPRHSEIMSRLKQLFLFLGLRQSIAMMLGAVIFIGMGERMAERVRPIYLVALGGGAISVGLLNAMDNLRSALYAFPGGYLADRIGTKRALLIFNLMAMAGFLVVVFIPMWEAVIGGAFLWMISPAANFLTASAFGLIGTVWFALRGRDLKTHPVKGPDLSG